MIKITHLAARQQRNLTRPQLFAIGMAPGSLSRWLRVGRLFRTGFPGVYSVGCPPITPHEHAMAAVLACGEGALLSHGSALALYGIWKRWDRPFDVTVPVDRRPRGVRAHRRRLDRRDITRHYGIPVTTLARALLDMAPGLTAKSLTRHVNNGRETGNLRLEALAAVVERNPGHPGRAKLSYCIGIAPDRPSRSGFEDDFPAFCRRFGLPQPLTNVVVCGYEVDAFFPNEKVIVELDGWDFHSSRVSFEDDRDRDADTTAAGCVTVRLTRERFRRQPRREAERLRAILAQRAS